MKRYGALCLQAAQASTRRTNGRTDPGGVFDIYTRYKCGGVNDILRVVVRVTPEFGGAQSKRRRSSSPSKPGAEPERREKYNRKNKIDIYYFLIYIFSSISIQHRQKNKRNRNRPEHHGAPSSPEERKKSLRDILFLRARHRETFVCASVCYHLTSAFRPHTSVQPVDSQEIRRDHPPTPIDLCDFFGFLLSAVQQRAERAGVPRDPPLGRRSTNKEEEIFSTPSST